MGFLSYAWKYKPLAFINIIPKRYKSFSDINLSVLYQIDYCKMIKGNIIEYNTIYSTIVCKDPIIIKEALKSFPLIKEANITFDETPLRDTIKRLREFVDG